MTLFFPPTDWMAMVMRRQTNQGHHDDDEKPEPIHTSSADSRTNKTVACARILLSCRTVSSESVRSIQHPYEDRAPSGVQDGDSKSVALNTGGNNTQLRINSTLLSSLYSLSTLSTLYSLYSLLSLSTFGEFWTKKAMRQDVGN